MEKKLIFITILVLHSLADAALGVNFYLSPQSLFSSGQTSVQTLEKKQVSSEVRFDYLVEENRVSRWVPSDKIACDLDLSEKVIFQNHQYTLDEIKGSMALITSESKRDWVFLTELKPSSQDFGYALTLISTTLRTKPTWSSDMVLTVPPKTRLKIEKIEDSWLQVRFFSGNSSTLGYVDGNNVLLKADFATNVLNAQGEWKKVLYREGLFMNLENKKTILLSEIKAWRTDRKKAILTESLPQQKLVLRQNVQIKKAEAQLWVISNLEGHGKVYWKRNQQALTAFILNKEDFLKREIFSVSWDSKNSKIGLASSHGIYFTQNSGENWQLLPQFMAENHPVLIDPSGFWFVGSLKSKDQGLSFKNFIRMDFLTKLVQSQSRTAPRGLRLSDIQYKNSLMQISVDTGTQKFKLATKSKEDSITDWDFVN